MTAPGRIELRHLRSYVAVAEERHFRRAAERLHLSQPPVSLQIRQLEEALGVQLLQRDRRGVAVTPAGEAFLVEARAVLRAMDRAAEVAHRTAAGELGRLVVGFVGSSMYGAVPELLRAFRTAHPGVELVLRDLGTAAQAEALESGDIDVGFLRPPVTAPDLVIEPFLREELIAVLPEDHVLATGGGSVPLRRLRDERFVLLSRASAPGLHESVVSSLTRAGRAPDVVQEADELQTVVGLVAAGLGISLVPASVRALDRHDVVYRAVAGAAPRADLAIARCAGTPSPALAAFLAQAQKARHAAAAREDAGG